MKNNENSDNEFYVPFHLKSYWEQYYKNAATGENSEWYFDMTKFQSANFNFENFDRQAEIIILGVGNSKIVDYLISKKFLHVTMVDFSQYLIEQLKKKYEVLPECEEWDCIKNIF